MLPVVQKIEKIIAEDVTLNHEYLPVTGLETFCEAATKMLLGSDCKPLVNGQVSIMNYKRIPFVAYVISNFLSLSYSLLTA